MNIFNKSTITSIKSIGVIILLAVNLSSCIETVELNLRSIEPQLVIEGKITDDSTQNEVKITLTQDFQQRNEFPLITTAQVNITDVTTGENEELALSFLEVYPIKKLRGISGHTYKLTVKYNGKTYEATSTMPQKVVFQALKYQSISRIDTKTKMVVIYKDPKDQINYYRWATIGNDGIRSRAFFVRNDVFNNGNQIEQVIDSGIDINSGDKISIEMQCIDKATFEYFLTLVKQQGQGLNNGAAGSNPPTNISGGALGYFGAYTVETKAITIL